MRLGETALVAGLISGTSADGVDAVCCERSVKEGRPSWTVLATTRIPYPTAIADALRAPERLDVAAVTRLDVEIGRRFADAAMAVVRAAGKTLDEIALIGSHGQTLWHDPRGERGGVPATLQIGEAAEIAARTGCPVWSDFRPADIAAGGEGAPLVPYVDWLLFADPERFTVCLNLGGIANVTLIPPAAALADVTAFDTGPANMVLDALARRLLGADHDADGSEARAGTVDPARLQAALADPFFDRPAPKSTGREAFGAAFVDRHFGPFDGLSAADRRARFATAAALTIESVARAIEGRCGTPPVPSDAAILVSGGGRHNAALMAGLAERCAPRRVEPVDLHGIDGDAKEALAFAILAYESARGEAVNVPAATGARYATRCGKLTLPPPR